MPEITIEQLTKAFGSETALNEVSFTVSDGQLVTLLGPSGCGKTTTLQSIAGFQQPDSGRIVCGDQVFFDAGAKVNHPAEGRNLGIVFQSYAVWPHMTVAANVGFPLKLRKRSRAEVERRVSATLELVEMGPYAARYPHELSGGQQQRVALARALVYEPSVLLLDEPFSNLDAKLRERTRVWLKQLQSELALTTVFVTHDQDEALVMSDRILVMDRGKILQSGSPEEVYRQPTSRFVAEFLGQCNILSGRVIEPSHSGRPRVSIGSRPNGATLAVTGHARVGEAVEVALRPEAIELAEADTPFKPEVANAMLAEVRRVSFLGDHYRYDLVACDVELIASSPTPIAGERVMVRLPPDACRIVDDREPMSAVTAFPATELTRS